MKCKECGQDVKFKPGNFVRYFGNIGVVVFDKDPDPTFIRVVNLRSGEIGLFTRSMLHRVHGYIHITSEER